MGNEHDSWLSDLGIDFGKIFGGGATTETDSSDKPGQAVGGLRISKPVGKGGKNNDEDVKMVQAALNSRMGTGLAVDGGCGKKTIAAIKAFQKSLGMSKPDGLVSPGKATAIALAGAAPPLPPGDPSVPGKIDLSLRSPKPPGQVKSDSNEDDSGNLLEDIVKGVEDFVDDVIKPKENGGSEEIDYDPKIIAKVTDSIITKLKAGKSIKPEIQVLEGTRMRGVLEALKRLKKANRLEAFANVLTNEHQRIGVAVLAIKGECNAELVSDLSPEDQEAIFESEGKMTVDDKGVTVEASLTFKAGKTNIGKTEFGIILNPDGTVKAIDLDLTLIEGSINSRGPLGLFRDWVNLDASLSLSTDVELSPEQTKAVLEKVRSKVKAEISYSFKRISWLKGVTLKFFITGGAEGIGGGGALQIQIPRK